MSARHALAAFDDTIIGPEQPRGDRAPGRPGFRQRGKRLGGRAVFKPEGQFCRLLKGKITRREDIRMAGIEHQIDFRRPGADALDADQRRGRLRDRHRVQVVDGQRAAFNRLRNRAQGAHLGTGQPAKPQGRVIGGQNRPGRDGAKARFGLAPDGIGARDGELLADDDLAQALESRSVTTQRNRAGQRDHGPEARILRGKMRDALLNVGLGLDDSHGGSAPGRYQTAATHAMQPVFRFAPSPNGHLHLGHAYSALQNQEAARVAGGRFIVRIEDIDRVRCTPALIGDALDDLHWLGLAWEEPVLCQSQRFPAYRLVLEQLWSRGLLYACICSRKDIETDAGARSQRDPDGALLYPGRCRCREEGTMHEPGKGVALRLDMARALESVALPLTWHDAEAGTQVADPARWGDVVLARKDTPASYHLAVVIDDAFQGVTDIVRGRDLFAATDIHRLLQALLGLPVPRYRHHALITDADGQKLAKSRLSTPLRALRAEGVTPEAIRRSFGL